MKGSPHQEDNIYQFVNILRMTSTSFSLEERNSTTPELILGECKSFEIPLLPLISPLRQQEIDRRNFKSINYSGKCISENESFPFVDSEMCHVFQSDLISKSGTNLPNSNPFNEEQHQSTFGRQCTSPSVLVMEDRTFSSTERHCKLKCNNLASLSKAKDLSTSYEVEHELCRNIDRDSILSMDSSHSLSSINTALDSSKLFQKANDDDEGKRRREERRNFGHERRYDNVAKVEELDCDSFKVSIPLIRNMSMAEIMNLLADPEFLENWCESIPSLVVTNQSGFSPPTNKVFVTVDNNLQPVLGCADDSGYATRQVDDTYVTAPNEARTCFLEASHFHPEDRGSMADERVHREKVRSKTRSFL